MRIIAVLIMVFISDKGLGQLSNRKIDELFTEITSKEKSANSLLIIHQGKLLYGKSVGISNVERQELNTPKTNFRMASVTKQFTAAAIYLLQKNNKLNYSQPISDFFPDFSPIGKKITIHHLLTHTSGIIDYEEIMPANLTEQLSDADVLAMVKSVEKTYFEIGSQFRYSNTAYCLLALIIEKTSGKSYSEYIKSEIFEPLKMNSSTVYEKDKAIENRAMGYKMENNKIVFSDQSLTSATKGDGGIYTSLNDYEKWYKNRKSKLGLDFFKMFEASKTMISDDSYYSFGWFLHRKSGSPDVMFHSGSTCGFTNFVIEIPATQTLIVNFSNVASHSKFFGAIEELLREERIVPKDFSFWKLHDKTN